MSYFLTTKNAKATKENLFLLSFVCLVFLVVKRFSHHPRTTRSPA